MNAQIQALSESMQRLYDKTSLLMRVLIGLGLGAIIVVLAHKEVLKPTDAAIAKLQSELAAIETAGQDVTAMVRELDQNAAILERNAQEVRAQNANLAEIAGVFSRADNGRLIAFFRTLLDQHNLRLISEERTSVQPNVAYEDPLYSRRTRRNTVAEPTTDRVPAPTRAGMKMESYSFKVLGRFSDILDFLRAAYVSPKVFFLTNVEIKTSTEMLVDRNFQQYIARECAFEFHIPYISDATASSAAKTLVPTRRSSNSSRSANVLGRRKDQE